MGSVVVWVEDEKGTAAAVGDRLCKFSHAPSPSAGVCLRGHRHQRFLVYVRFHSILQLSKQPIKATSTSLT